MLDVDTPHAFNVRAVPVNPVPVTAGGSAVILVPVPGSPGQDGTPGADGTNGIDGQDGAPGTGGGGADWTPEDFGLAAWSFTPIGISSRDTAMFNGALTLIGIKIAAATTITNVHNFVITPGTNLTAGQSFGALYQNGNLLAVTADQSTAWATTVGRQDMALSSPQAVDPGMVYVGFWSVGDTPPSLGALLDVQQAFAKSINRFAIDLGSYPVSTTAPATLGSLIDGIGYWAAVS